MSSTREWWGWREEPRRAGGAGDRQGLEGKLRTAEVKVSVLLGSFSASLASAWRHKDYLEFKTGNHKLNGTAR